MELSKALTISSLGLQVQSARFRALAATLANQDAAASSSPVGPRRRGGGSSARSSARASRLSPARATPHLQGFQCSPDAGVPTDGRDARPIQDVNQTVLEATRLLLTRTIDMLR